MSSVAGRKRPSSALQQQARLKPDHDLCSFCQATPAAVSVLRRAPHRKHKRAPHSYCLRHYYSTSAVREEQIHVSVLDSEQVALQIPAVQELFADAFIQLQQGLSEEAARAFASHADDPLAVISDLHSNNRRKLKAPPKPPLQMTTTSAQGGFLRETRLPERLLRTQQEQMQKQQQLTERMHRAASSSHKDISQRRKPSRKSIWNVILEEQQTTSSRHESTKQKQTKRTAPIYFENNDFSLADEITCSCGSSNVQVLASNSSRNQDMSKGETWGTKDRADEVMTRCRCLECGKVWNQEA